MTKRVCWRCIGEELLSADIRANNPRRECAYCGSRRPAIALDALRRIVDPVFREIIGTAEDGFEMRDGEPWFGPMGERPSELINQMLIVDDEQIGLDLVSLLSHQYQHDFTDGGEDFYDDTSDHYAIRDDTDDLYRRGWESFCDELKHHRRFFLDNGTALLDQLLGPIVRGEWPAGGAIREIGPGTDYLHIYRGRLANEITSQRSIYVQRRKRLGAPAPGLAGSGRMNAAGISVFYGSFDLDTCVAELRTPVGGHAIVGRFEILAPLRVLDLTLLEQGFEPLSYFHPNYTEGMAYQAFMQNFHEEVRKAVLPGHESLDYLPTQIIAEYLWTRADPPLDGLIFGSAQISETSNNIVLFPHACSVEGAEDEPEREIAHLYARGHLEDDDPDWAADMIDFVPLAAPTDGIPSQPDGANSGGWMDMMFDEIEPAPPEAARLRLGDDDVWRIRVAGIRYQTEAIQARFEEQDTTDF